MGDVRVTRAAWVLLMYHLCVMITVFGVFWEFGIGWAAMFGGLVEALFFLFVAETDENEVEK